MTLPPVRFFVFVIESPSPLDLYHRRSEGNIIQKAVNLNNIECIVKTAISQEAFEACLKIGLSEAMKILTDKLPVLHISAHGDSNGIQLSSGEIIEWNILRQFLSPINQALNNNLLVCLSSCEGYSGTKMAMFLEDQGYPFYGIVANSEKPIWSETAVAYTSFYHLLAKGEDINNAVDSMRIASGNNLFFFRTAEGSRKLFLEYMNKTDPQQVRERLEQSIKNEPPNHLAKLRNISKD